MSDLNSHDNNEQPLENSARETTSHAPTPDRDHVETERYLDLIRSVHQEWETLEQQGDPSVQLSPAALSSIKDSVRADARHGAHIEMPPTSAGTYTLSELSLRSLVRHAIDSVPGVIALRTTIDYAPAYDFRTRGRPTHIHCRISAPLDARDLPQLAHTVRDSIASTCREHLDLTVDAIDIHIEDLHEH